MNEYRVKVTIRNNLLLSAIESAGYQGWGSISRFCADAGIRSTEFARLASMRRPPINQDGEFTVCAKAIMETLGAAPSDLWTDAQLTMCLAKNSAEATMSHDAVQAMLEQHAQAMYLPSPEDVAEFRSMAKAVDSALQLVSKREEKVLRMRFGLGLSRDHTLEETAEVLGVTRERVRQIESKALRKLRHPSRVAVLKGAGVVRVEEIQRAEIERAEREKRKRWEEAA